MSDDEKWREQLTPEEYHALPKHPIHLVLDNLRSAFNVGSLFRLADTARLSQVVTCGYTAHPPHPKLDKALSKIGPPTGSKHTSAPSLPVISITMSFRSWSL